MPYDAILLLKLMLVLIFIISYYRVIKNKIIYYAGKFAKHSRLSHYYPYEVAKGVIELPCIVLTHLFFCVILAKTCGIAFPAPGAVSLHAPYLLLYGILLGLGIMGTASLLGRFYIEIMHTLFPKKFPTDMKHWLVMVRSGWIRHYLHVLQALPLPIALLIAFGQVCGEEIVFRGILTPYFLPYGQLTAIILSTLLFMYMQLFQMPNRVSGIFPMIGALVMGTVGSILYLQVPDLLPLMIAHMIFFSVAVL